MEDADAGGSSVDSVSEASPTSIERPDVAAVDKLVDLWVALAADQRAHDSHILADENRAVVRDTLARHAVTGGIRIARLEGTLVGFVTFGIERGSYEQDEVRGVVRNVYVDPACRDDGVGTALMDAAEAALREAGATVVSLEAMAANRRAREFYRDRGYATHRIQFEKPISGHPPAGSSERDAAGGPSAENDTHSKED
ncbi:GNAT family N-acetyltransferase [Halobellus captivus]|uniref:GNAT family N-acetyltransferase n=1 Tax=Halobellus captivus TaxID=2592614 RepID=UPI0011A0B6F8|nr:GNAT family N-acetyltransferase [Halobellus captivus]